MTVLGPGEGPSVRKATAADKAAVDAVRPKSLPNAEALILSTGEVAFRVRLGKETDDLLREMAENAPPGLRPGDIVGTKRVDGCDRTVDSPPHIVGGRLCVHD